MKVLFQIDEDNRIRPAGDTSFALMLEAHRRGWEVWRAHPSDLFVRSSELRYKARQVIPVDRAEAFFEPVTIGDLALDYFDVMLIRQDPPFDQSYLANVQVLATYRGNTRILNAPEGLLDVPEKIAPFRFSRWAPRTVLASSLDQVRSAFPDFATVVLKPLYGGGGEGVAKLDLDSRAAEHDFAKFVNANHNGPIIVQEFLPRVVLGDKRAVMIDGVVRGVLQRVPAEGDFRANIHIGGSGKLATLTGKEQQICDDIAPFLRECGIFLAGIDLLDEHLIEINVTSPTLFREIKNLGGVDLASIFWDELIRKFS